MLYIYWTPNSNGGEQQNIKSRLSIPNSQVKGGVSAIYLDSK